VSHATGRHPAGERLPSAATSAAWVAVARYQLLDARHRMAAAATRSTTDSEDVGVLEMPLAPGFPAFVRTWTREGR
jgi:hypothetical protein